MVEEDKGSGGEIGASPQAGQPAGALRAEPLSGVSGKAAHQAQGLIVRAYEIAVSDFSPHTYVAGSRGKALRDAWWSYCNYRQVTFGEFLKVARCRLGLPRDLMFGREITVGGKPALYVSRNNQYVQFVRPGSDVIMNSHPFDVEPEDARPWTYRDRGSKPVRAETAKTGSVHESPGAASAAIAPPSPRRQPNV